MCAYCNRMVSDELHPANPVLFGRNVTFSLSSRQSDINIPHRHWVTSRRMSKNCSRLMSAFFNPSPTTTGLCSTGFLSEIALAICTANSWPTISRSGVEFPNKIEAVRCGIGRRLSSVELEGRKWSVRLGLVELRGTCI